MAFEPLPNVYLSWDESTVDYNEFLRYNIYRRRVLEDSFLPWVLIDSITARGTTEYNDYTVPSGTWQYAVTQMRAFAGEEVESDFPSAPQIVMVIRDGFIHVKAQPSRYAQLATPQVTEQIQQDIIYHRMWSKQKPISYIDNHHNFEYSFDHLEPDKDEFLLYSALLDLQQAQRDGLSLYLRHGATISTYVVLDSMSASRVPGIVSFPIRFVEVEAPSG